MDQLTIAGKAYASRLLVGTGKYKDFAETGSAIEASGVPGNLARTLWSSSMAGSALPAITRQRASPTIARAAQIERGKSIETCLYLAIASSSRRVRRSVSPAW